MTMTVDTYKLPNENLARGSAEAIIRLMHVVCMHSIREDERESITKAAVKWFLNLAEHMGIRDAHVQAMFVNQEDGSAKCEYTPLNDSARIVKDFLLQCELAEELSKG